MKRIFTTVLLIVAIAIGCIALYAQSDAGFLDGTGWGCYHIEWSYYNHTWHGTTVWDHICEDPNQPCDCSAY